MANLSTLIPLIGNLTSGVSSNEAFLHVPSNLHVFHKYYSKHYSYKYWEKYSFADKIWVFDGKAPDEVDGERIFEGLKYANERKITSGHGYRRDHLLSEFVDWSKNGHYDTLRDILKLDFGSSKPLFSPVEKHIYLDYSHAQTNIIPEYSFYSDGRYEGNKYSAINFGKHKQKPKYLKDVGLPKSSSLSCTQNRGNYTPHHKLFTEEEGYDGICDKINIQGHNWSFSDTYRSSSTMWTTPYAAYRYMMKDNWNVQYYYYSLGDFALSAGRSKNLLQSSNTNAWFIDYDDVFAVRKDGNVLKVTLNETAEQVKKLNLSSTNNNQNLANFLSISDKLNFQIVFEHFGKRIEKYFTIREVLEDKAEIAIPHDADYFAPQFMVSVSPKNTAEMVFANPHNHHQKYHYKVNIDALSEANKLFSDLVFDDKKIKNIFPSELLSGETIAKYFSWEDKDGVQQAFDPKFLKLLQLSGEVNDVEGTATLSYKINGQTKHLDLEGMQKLPDMSGNFYAADAKDALAKLKEHYFQVGDYFWKHLSFHKRYEGEWYDPTAKLSTLFTPLITSDYSSNISSGGKSEFKDLNIHLMAAKDLLLIQREAVPDYSHLYELFDMNDYSRALGLNKHDYTYKVVSDEEDSFDVLVSLNRVPDRADLMAAKNTKKVYTFPKDRFKSSEDKKKDNTKRKWWETLLSSENIVATGAGTIFSGAALYAVLRKFKWIKPRSLDPTDPA